MPVQREEQFVVQAIPNLNRALLAATRQDIVRDGANAIDLLMVGLYDSRVLVELYVFDSPVSDDQGGRVGRKHFLVWLHCLFVPLVMKLVLVVAVSGVGTCCARDGSLVGRA